MQQSSPEGYALACEMLARTGAPNWSRIEVPVLLIAGREDQISSVEAAEAVRGACALSLTGLLELCRSARACADGSRCGRLAGCLTSSKSARVVVVEAGHQPAVECPEAVLALLDEFLS